MFTWYYKLLAILCLSLLPTTLSSQVSRSPHMKLLDGEKQLDSLKGYKNGSIVVYVKKPNIKFEENIVRAFNQISKYGIKLRKVNCQKSSMKQCQYIKDQMVVLYKKGEEKIMKDIDIEGTNMAINSFLFFMASAGFEKLVFCSNMEQVYEIIEMDRTILNTVLGCFKKHDSEQTRRFLEAAMETGHQYAYILLSTGARERQAFNKDGYYVTLYKTKFAKPGEEVETQDISSSIKRSNDLGYVMSTVAMTEDLLKYATKMKDAEKKRDKQVEEITKKAMDELMKNKNYGGEGEEDNRRIAEEMLLKKGGRVDVNDYLKLNDIFLLNKVKREFSEIGFDAYNNGDRHNRLLYRKSDVLLDVTELEREMENVNKSSQNILMVLFHVPWDSVYQVFEPTYYELFAEMEKKDSSVKIRHFDCWSWPGPCNSMNIHTYPTIKIFRYNMDPLTYNGYLEKESIKTYIKFLKDDFLPQLVDTRQLKDLVPQFDEPVVFGIFANQSDTTGLQSIFRDVALEYYGKIKVGILITKKTKSSFKLLDWEVKIPSVITINAKQQQKAFASIDNWNEQVLRDWINEQTLNQVEELTPLTFPSLLKINKPFIISFRNKTKSRKSLQRFAVKNSDVVTVWMDSEKEMTQTIHKTYNLQNNETIAMLHKEQNLVFEFTDGKKSIENISKWMTKCLNKEVEPTYILPTTEWPGMEGHDFLKKLDDIQNGVRKTPKKANRTRSARDITKTITKGKSLKERKLEEEAARENKEDDDDFEMAVEQYKHLDEFKPKQHKDEL